MTDGERQTHLKQRSIEHLWWEITPNTRARDNFPVSTGHNRKRQSFMCLGRAGLQCFGVLMVVSTVDTGLQELQRYDRRTRHCP
ncbi:hypothetical protein SFRURICE_004564 [Spodoptera frugiperda]|nr:hypothetical protein SFRURICE_004564 [Spodoptera frugiperda]